MRLIDADAFRKEIPVDKYGHIETTITKLCIAIEHSKVDAVQVVRCKDCKHFVRSEGVCKLLSNNYEPPVYVDDDDFCSRGERRSE